MSKGFLLIIAALATACANETGAEIPSLRAASPIGTNVSDAPCAAVDAESGQALRTNEICHREEVLLKAQTELVGAEADGSGAIFYGDGDAEHAGWIGLFTGGASRLSVNRQGHVGIGFGVLQDYRNDLPGHLSILADGHEPHDPGLYIDGPGESDGDIAWRDGEVLQLGTWMSDGFVGSDKGLAGTFREKMRVTSDGYVGIGTRDPACALDVTGTVRATNLEFANDDGSATDVASSLVKLAKSVADLAARVAQLESSNVALRSALCRSAAEDPLCVE